MKMPSVHLLKECGQSVSQNTEGALLEVLCCPFCGGGFQLSKATFTGNRPEYGILTCHCCRYPIVAGIPVLKKNAGSTFERVLGLIESGQLKSALLTMLVPGSPSLAGSWTHKLPSSKASRWLKHISHDSNVEQWQQRAKRLLDGSKKQVSACELFDFYFQDSRNAYDYFAYRPGQPRHLVALSFITIIREPKKPILDLACGCGHLTSSLICQAQKQPVIGIDDWFFGVYVAKHWLAPEAEYVCCSADSPLPFADGAFSTVFCSDAFHYFTNKLMIFNEAKRLTRDDGMILLVWVHNALWRCHHDGFPLRPEGYRDLVADMPHRLVADREVLARYLNKNGPPLAVSAGSEQLAGQPVISIVASYREDVFRDHDRFADWPHAQGRLELNPLYVKDGENENGHLHFHRSFPSAFYEQEHQDSKNYLPVEVNLHSDVIEDLKNGKRTSKISELLDQCFIIGMPERYRASEFSQSVRNTIRRLPPI